MLNKYGSHIKHFVFFSGTIFMFVSFRVNGQGAINPQAAPGVYGSTGNTVNRTCFTENKGQIVDMAGQLRPDVLYKGEISGVDIYLRKTGISYVHSNVNKVMHEIEEQTEEKEHADLLTPEKKESKDDLIKLRLELEQKSLLKIHRLDVDFVDANDNPNIYTSAPIGGYNNYYYAHCPKGILNVGSFGEVTTKNIYNNIDVKYYGENNTGLKYDIIVNPGGDAEQIKLNYSGAEEIKVENGKLLIKTSLGELIESMPKVYQHVNGEIIDIKAAYILTGTIVSMRLEEWNHSFPLVIDPWVSYYGGNTYDGGTAVDTDPAGNLVFCGHTTSTNFPNTAGSFQTSFAGPTSFLNSKGDVFIAKMSAAGTGLWATYYGGNDNETAVSIATDAAGNIFVTGHTVSTNFPIGFSGANVVHQSIYGGGGVASENWFKGDAFVIALNTAGTRLWATYYGGSSDDMGGGIATDGSNIYLSGSTYSGNAISSGIAFQPAINGTGTVSTTMCDAFAVKFSPNGSVTWGTYVGGANKDKGSGITCDLAGNIYLAGGTASTNFPVSGACYQPVFGGGGGDGFLFKFSPAGARIWATYYGGSYQTMYDLPIPVVTDGLNNVIFAHTISGNINVITNDGSSSAGAYQPLYGGGLFEGNIVKLNPGGTRMWATYLGGSSDEYALSLAVDATNNIYVYGEWEDTDSKNYQISACAYQPVSGGGEDQFIAKYDPNGQQRCITYMGGSREDDLDNGGSNGITVNGSFLYITGYTTGGYPVTAGAYQTAYGAVQDGTTANAFVAQLCINICEGKSLIIAPSANAVTCPGTPVNFTPNVSNSCDTSGYKYKWTFTGGTPNTSTAQSPSVSYSAPGYYNVKLVVTTPCKKDSVTKINYVIVNPCTINATATGATLCSASNCTNITATGSSGTIPYTYSWNTGATTSTINVCPLIGTTIYTVMVTDAAGNYAATTTSVTVNRSPTLRTNSYNITCTQSGQAYVDSVNGKSSSQGTAGQIPWNYQFNWSNNSTWYSHNGLAPGGYTVTVTDLSNGCATIKTFNITGTGAASATFTSSTACIGSIVNFTNTGSSGTGVTHSWYIGTPVNTSGTTTNFSYTFLTAGSYNIDHTVTSGGCTNKVTNIITVINCNGPTATATGSSVCPGSCAAVTSGGTGGTAPYTYTWSNGATTQNINPCPLTTTTYTVTIKDSGGNTSTSTAIATINPAINVTVTSTNISCNGSTNGSVLANLTGGTSPFVYSWGNGQTSQTITGLASGNYTVTVTDSKGCTATSSSTVISPPPLFGQFTKGSAGCNGCGCKEWIMLNAAGGTSPYSYTWPDGYINRYKNQLCPGTYSINIKDKNGCSVNINLTAP